MKHDEKAISKSVHAQGWPFPCKESAFNACKAYAEHMAKQSNPWRALPVPDDVDNYLPIEVTDGFRERRFFATEWKGVSKSTAVWRYEEAIPTPEEIAAIYAEAENG